MEPKKKKPWVVGKLKVNYRGPKGSRMEKDLFSNPAFMKAIDSFMETILERMSQEEGIALEEYLELQLSHIEEMDSMVPMAEQEHQPTLDLIMSAYNKYKTP